MTKLVVFSLGATLLITVGLIFGPSLFGGSAEGGRIEIIPKEYDVGTISMKDGLVKKVYEIKNTGEGDLKIDRIWTSCMCTTAKLKVGDKESGEFGMHSNPVFWSQKINPGQTGSLEVTFDPAFHGPEGTGEVVRAVYLLTNDPQNEKAEVWLIADVIK